MPEVEGARVAHRGHASWCRPPARRARSGARSGGRGCRSQPGVAIRPSPGDDSGRRAERHRRRSASVCGSPARPIATTRPSRIPIEVLRTPSTGSSSTTFVTQMSSASSSGSSPVASCPSRTVLPKPTSGSEPGARVVGLDRRAAGRCRPAGGGRPRSARRATRTRTRLSPTISPSSTRLAPRDLHARAGRQVRAARPRAPRAGTRARRSRARAGSAR